MIHKSKKQRRDVALTITLAVEDFETLLNAGELEQIAELASPLELAFLQNVGRNLRKLNEMIRYRRIATGAGVDGGR